MKVITTNLLNRFWKNGVLPIKTTLSSKLDKSNVMNNLLTTQSGFALDARQGKTLNDKITQLNNEFGFQSYSQSDLTIADFYTVNDFDLRKRGNEVFFNVSLALKTGTQFDINTLYTIGPTPMIAALRPAGAKTFYLTGFGCNINWTNPVALSAMVTPDGYVKYVSPSKVSYFKFSGHWFTS